jgi:hypothetical protein
MKKLLLCALVLWGSYGFPCDCVEKTRYFLEDRISDLDEFYNPTSEEVSNYLVKGMLDAYMDCLFYLCPTKQSDKIQ